MYCFRPNILFKNWLYCSIYCSCTVQIFGLVGVSAQGHRPIYIPPILGSGASPPSADNNTHSCAAAGNHHHKYT